MAGRDIVVIGASAGAVKVLTQLARGLPPGLPASIFVACHLPPFGMSALPEIMSRSGSLLARFARDEEPIYPGHIYIAPPDRHLLLDDGRVRVTYGARENRHRPAIDPLFRSAARFYGPRVVGVVVSGALYDGVAGLMAVRNAGGVAVVQDPKDADVAFLPQNACDLAGADHVVKADALAALLVELVRQPVATKGATVMAETDPLEKMPKVAAADMEAQARGERRGALATFTCPECGGNLWQVDEQQLVRFRCHVGHAYVGEVLLDEQSASLEAALWTAVRIFKEKTVLARQLASAVRHQGNAAAVERFEDEARISERYSGLIQEYLLSGRGDHNPPGKTELETKTELT